MTKYRAKPTEVDGIRFASKAESRRYIELKLMQEHGVIRDLVLQPRYPIVVNGVKICTYVADFKYYDKERKREVVEDVKGMIPRLYVIKRQLMKAVYDINIFEVPA